MHIDSNDYTIAGVDIGGSHITVALVDIKDGVLLHETKASTAVNANGNASYIIQCWVDAIEGVIHTIPTAKRKMGVAMPGPFNYEMGISLMNTQNKFGALYQQNVRQLLSDKLNMAGENIIFKNDACCFLQGEMYCGQAIETKTVMAITLGTGLGSAFFNNGVIEDLNLWNKPFMNSIAEDYFSTRWFIKRWFQLTGELISGAKELVSLINTHNHARMIMDEFCNNFSVFLVETIRVYEPEVIVLGGNISKAYPYFLYNVQKKLKEQACGTTLVITALGEDAAIIGAAYSFHKYFLTVNQ